MTYDQANQLASRTDATGTLRYEYDHAGRLIHEHGSTGILASYEYGYLDKVMAVERGGQRVRFHYDGTGMLVAKEFPDGSLEKWVWDGIVLLARGDERYINEPHASGGVPIVSFKTGGRDIAYIQSDYLGTTFATYARDGSPTGMPAGKVSPFGHSLDGEMRAGLTGHARFTGKPYDPHLDAHVFPFRNYSVSTSRWTSSDPAGFPDGPNQHFYAPVPTTGIDPWGLLSVTATSLTPAQSQFTYNNVNYSISGSLSHSSANGQAVSFLSNYPNRDVTNAGIMSGSITITNFTGNYHPEGNDRGGADLKLTANDLLLWGDEFRWVQYVVTTVNGVQGPPILDTSGSDGFYGSPSSNPFSFDFSDFPGRHWELATKEHPVTWTAWLFLAETKNVIGGEIVRVYDGIQWSFTLYEL